MKRIIFLFSLITVSLAISIPGIPGRSAVSGLSIPKVGGGLDFKGVADKFMNVAAKGPGMSNLGGGLDVKGAADKFMNLAGKGLGASNMGGGLNIKGVADKFMNLAGKGSGTSNLGSNLEFKGLADKYINSEGKDRKENLKQRTIARPSRKNKKNDESANEPVVIY